MQTNFKYRFNEGKVLKEIEHYIQQTYGQHYVGKSNLQMIDIWNELDITGTACISNVLKYVYRHGKKKGQEKTDLLKAIHYAILAYSYYYGDEKKELDK